MKFNFASFILAAMLAPVSVVAMAQSNPLPAPVTVVQVGNETILADRNQMTVYTYDPDSPGVSNCTGACAKAWPPVVLLATDQVSAPFGVTVRSDTGAMQLLYENHPLYNYIGDAKPGDILGNGLGGIWHIIPFSLPAGN